jgi:hypothetical protein
MVRIMWPARGPKPGVTYHSMVRVPVEVQIALLKVDVALLGAKIILANQLVLSVCLPVRHGCICPHLGQCVWSISL